MKVVVHYLAHLKQAAGIAREEAELAESSSLAELLPKLAARHGDPLRRLLLDNQGGLQPTILLFVNDTQVADARTMHLHDGDEIALLSPIAGG
jgi:molybdopterin converting factor small subunit